MKCKATSHNLYHIIRIFVFFLLLLVDKELFLYYLLCKMHIPPCSIELNNPKSFLQKCVNTTYATVSMGRLFSFCYQHQVINRMRLWKFRILLPDWFTLANQPWYTAQNTPFPKQSVFGMVSTLLRHLCSALL